ncbi:MAG: ATP-dependent DNA helicase [Acetobacteraceae bacterium]
MPDAPAVVARHGRAALLTPDGEILILSTAEAVARLAELPPPILVHAPATFRRLGLPAGPAFDLLDLFAFAMPGRIATASARGLALALTDGEPPDGLEAEVAVLPTIASLLLNHLWQGRDLPLNRTAASLAARMGRAGWGWGAYVVAALDQPDAIASLDALKAWRHLPEWEETAPTPPASAFPVTDQEARSRLAALLGVLAEQRPGQADYAAAASAAFAPRERRGDPHFVLAEAGTGVGKTLGYIAPASLWSEKNRGTVWISTFTRHLQRQIDQELERLVADPQERRQRFVVRKGRENYLCLLNFEDAVNALAGGLGQQYTIPLGLIARWILATQGGDMQGGDLPGWLGELHGMALIGSLTDRRGECIHSACPHWRKCFIEHTIRRARTAQLVVANHALVMLQAAWGGLDDPTVPSRYVFDEGHHLFDAADSAFSAALTGLETAELRRWLRGAEGRRSRARGLRRRVEDLLASHPALEAPMEAALMAANALPPSDWAARLRQGDALHAAGGEPAPANPTEAFLQLVHQQVLARTAQAGTDPRGGAGTPAYAGSLQCDVFPVAPPLAAAADRLVAALGRIAEPLQTLRNRLLALLDLDADELDTATRSRIDAIARTLERRALIPLLAWQAMLRHLLQPQEPEQERPQHVHFFSLDRDGIRDIDVGLHRHWLDPTIPFIGTLAEPAHGVLVTSATLRDSGDQDPEIAWSAAETQVGATLLPSPAVRAAVASPFDYASQTRAFVVTDVSVGDIAQLASAYRVLFLAAGGGGLGLFTAIRRLREVHGRIAPELAARDIPLYAQHVDAMSNASLVDVFRSEESSCLLGTDAMRDGVDVPGQALRLVVLERVPWPRPDILHRERRIHLSGGQPKAFDDRIARLRLRQAFGRLIRRASDRGVFVLLDRQTPTRLLSAFPEGVATRRVGLAEAAAQTAAFLSKPTG